MLPVEIVFVEGTTFRQWMAQMKAHPHVRSTLAGKSEVEVREALATHYPADQATGFQTGDLRGWFWVTVPAGARSPGTNAPTSANEKL